MTTASCKVCGGTEHRLYGQAEEPFRILQCLGCGLVYTHPVPDAEALASHYDEGYYREWREAQGRARRRMWGRRLDKVRRYVPRGRLLDVGCGLGTFLVLAREAGFEVRGTEVSPFIAETISRESNLDIHLGEVEAARFPKGYFDVVTMWHVLEHMTDPGAVLRECRRILKETGLLVVAVPNLRNHLTRGLYRVVKRRPFPLFSACGKEPHLFHFTPETLGNLLGRSGFRVLRWEPDLSAVVWQRKIIDMAAWAIFGITGRNYADGFQVFAVPEERGE